MPYCKYTTDVKIKKKTNYELSRLTMCIPYVKSTTDYRNFYHDDSYNNLLKTWQDQWSIAIWK